MIVPQNRLILWTAVAGAALAALAAVQPGAWAAGALAATAFILIAVLDVLQAVGRLTGVKARFAEVTRLSKGHEGCIDIDIEQGARPLRKLRVGIALPPDISSPHEDMLVDMPKDTPCVRVSWPCTPRARGRFVLENVYIEAASPLGLWSHRRVAPARGEVRVYPDLISERKHLASLFLNSGTLGIHAQRQVGKGREFEQLREYIPGDGYEDIHWKATAKRGHPVTKIYQIERTQEVYVAIDASRLSARRVGDPPSTQLERFITTSLVLGLVAERQGDLFGIAAFDDKVHTFIRARNGKTHYDACRDALYTMEPKLVNPDYGELCSFLRLHLRRRALVILLTNLDDPVLAESLEKNLELMARHHLVLVNMVKLPGVAPLFSAPPPKNLDGLYEHLGGHIRWAALRELEKTLQRHGVSMNLVDQERMAPELVSQYINVKRRQAL